MLVNAVLLPTEQGQTPSVLAAISGRAPEASHRITRTLPSRRGGLGELHLMMSKRYKGSQGLCRSVVAILLLKDSSAAFLPP